MSTVVQILKNFSVSFLSSLVKCVEKIFIFLIKKMEMKEDKLQKNENKKFDKDLKDACDKGNLQDLINVTKKISIIVFCLVLVGCIHDKIVVSTSETWEGRYDNVEELQENVKKIKLDKKESVWMLRNDTLYYLLENARNSK